MSPGVASAQHHFAILNTTIPGEAGGRFVAPYGFPEP
jgi:hypothetical protein